MDERVTGDVVLRKADAIELALTYCGDPAAEVESAVLADGPSWEVTLRGNFGELPSTIATGVPRRRGGVYHAVCVTYDAGDPNVQQPGSVTAWDWS